MLQLKGQINDRVAALAPQLIAYRRHIHQHPELSFKEYETSAFIQNVLRDAGIPFQVMVETGVVALIKGNKTNSDKCIALRADMDALPIQERNEVSYASQNNGVMHACGHDVHTACLLGAALVLNDMTNEFSGTVKLIFQPGEEVSPGGANLMVQAGVLQNPEVNAIVGLHVFPEMPVGYLGFKSGEYMASSDELYITVKGRGGHAALPHKCVDPITIAADIIMSLQQIVSRKANALTPTVLSFGKIQGGHTNNVIPDEVVLEGTLRTFDEVWRKEALSLIEKICQDIAGAYGGSAEFNHPPGYPSVFNNVALTERVTNLAKAYWGSDRVESLDRRMTAEDFSFYSHQTSGCFFRLGTNTNNEENITHVHNAGFNVDENAIAIGSETMIAISLEYLNN